MYEILNENLLLVNYFKLFFLKLYSEICDQSAARRTTARRLRPAACAGRTPRGTGRGMEAGRPGAGPTLARPLARLVREISYEFHNLSLNKSHLAKSDSGERYRRGERKGETTIDPIELSTSPHSRGA